MTLGNSIPVGPKNRAYYGIVGKTGDVRFFVVERPTAGKWAGFTFVKGLVADGTYTLKAYPLTDKQYRVSVTRYIEQHAEKCSAVFGEKFKTCGICNRPLTDPESLARGIGPICAGKAGW